MNRPSLIAAAVLALSVSAARPAAAEQFFVEPYLNIFGARTVLGGFNDPRPQDVTQRSTWKEGHPRERFLVSAGGFVFDEGAVATSGYGGGVAYANGSNERHPWQLSVTGSNSTFTGGPDFGAYDIGGKFMLWQPSNTTYPAISLIARYNDIPDAGRRTDVLLALDQRVASNVYMTSNLGWGRFTGLGSAFVSGLGVNWRAGQRLSVTLDYSFDSKVNVQDFWSIGFAYSMGKDSVLRLGSGKHSLFFGSVSWKFDR